jgi:hypothetical protein
MGDGAGQGKHQKAPGCIQCPAGNGTTPPQPGSLPQPACSHEGVAVTAAALLSNSSRGPWTPAGRIPNRANAEAAFSRNGTLWISLPTGYHSNDPTCTPTPGAAPSNGFFSVVRAETLEDGLAGKWEALPMTYELAGAPEPAGKLTPEGNSTICFHWEDQTLWVDQRGHLHSFHHAWAGLKTDYPVPGCGGGRSYHQCQPRGGHAYSLDGRHWYISPVAMYDGTTEFDDGDTVHWRARERPHVMQDADKVITHLSNGVGDPNPPQCDEGNTGCPNHDHTFTLIQPVRTPAVIRQAE